jgi:hypothetical protein
MTEGNKRKPHPRPKAVSEQSRRFIRTARELGCDEDPEAFVRVFARVVPPKRRPDIPPAGNPPKPENKRAKRSATKRRLKGERPEEEKK